jgi:hypothetical protein
MSIDKLKINIKASQKHHAENTQLLLVEKDDGGFKRRYFDIESGKLLPLEFIKDRIEKSFSKVRKMTVEMAFDWHFIYTHQKEFGLEGRVHDWADENLPISRSYRFDIIKSIDLLLLDEKDKPFDELVQDAMAHFDQIGIGKLKLVAQVQESEIKKELLQELKEGKDLDAKSILKKNKTDGLAVSVNDKFKKSQLVMVDEVVMEIMAVNFAKEELELLWIDGETSQIINCKMNDCSWAKK